MPTLSLQLRPSDGRADTAITTVAAMITPPKGRTEPEVAAYLGFDPRSGALVNSVPEHVGQLHWHHTCSKHDTVLLRHANPEGNRLTRWLPAKRDKAKSHFQERAREIAKILGQSREGA